MTGATDGPTRLLIATLALVGALTLGLAGARAADEPVDLTLDVSASVVPAGGPVTLSGVLTEPDDGDPLFGGNITVTRYTGTDCSSGGTDVGSATTGSDGTYTADDSPAAGQYSYRAFYTGGAQEKNSDETFLTTSSPCRAVRANAPPVASAGGPYNGKEGTTVAVSAAGSTDDAGIASYAWTSSITSAPSGTACSFGDATAANTAFTCDDQGTFSVDVAVTDTDGVTAHNSAAVTLSNVAPTATFGNSGPVGPNAAATVSFSSPSDPSTRDVAAGFHYAFDCGGGSLGSATYANSGTQTSAGCSFSTAGTHTVSGAIVDKDGGKTVSTTDVVVNQAVKETADLAIAVSADPQSVEPGQHVAFTVTVTNHGPSTAHDVSVSDTLPAGVSFVSAGASQGSCSGTAPVTCALGDLPANSSATITIVGVANGEGTLSDGASVGSSTIDPVVANNAGAGSATSTQAPPPPPPSGQLTGTQVQGDVLVNGQPFTGGDIAYGSLVDVKPGGQITFSADVGKIVVFPPAGVETSFIVVRTTSAFRLPSGRTATAPTVQFVLTGGGLASCGTKAFGAKKKPPSRSLWANGHGHYRTKGKYSSATVSGTYWYTRDTCDGTLTKVKRGRVQIRDFVTKKTVFVTAGHSYFAAAHPKKTKPKKH